MKGSSVAVERNRSARTVPERKAQANPLSAQVGPLHVGGESDLVRECLSDHHLFTRRVTRHVVGFFVAPPLAYWLSVASADALRAFGYADAVVAILAYLLAAAITIGSMTVIVQSAFRLTDMHLAKLRRQSSFASEAVFVDNQNHVRDGVETLFRSWSHRIFLARWFYDIKIVLLTVLLILGLSAALFNAYVPIFELAVPDWREAGFLGILFIDIAATYSLLAALSRRAKTSPELNPAHPLEERMSNLLAEVKELRRGARINV